MLHTAVAAFLDSVTEREFDPTILALLAEQGFHDIHFIHGSFEFGKDIIAKRMDPATGVTAQYAIQSKAGDMSQADWRAVRPQLEEAEYNTRGHPNYDPNLPRAAVLLLTGRLKGAAATDAQEFAQTIARRGIARLEFWDQEYLTGWLVSRPDLAILSLGEQQELQSLLTDIRSGAIDEPALERFSRRWIESGTASTAAIEGAILVNALREQGRLDLAALCAIHQFRGACMRETGGTTSPHAESARRLFVAIAMLLLHAVEPLLDDPMALARIDLHPASLVSYAVAALRSAELLALAALVTDSDEERARLSDAVLTLTLTHPGAARPVSDQFAVSLIPITLLVHRAIPARAADFLKKVAKWLMDRHDPERGGLGLGNITEKPPHVVERLLGGYLAVTNVPRSQSSYVLTVLLDLCLALGENRLFNDVLADAQSFRITPCTTTVGSKTETFRRGGGPVHPVPYLDYGPERGTASQPPSNVCWSATDVLLLVASCRSRHYIPSWSAANDNSPVSEH